MQLFSFWFPPLILVLEKTIRREQRLLQEQLEMRNMDQPASLQFFPSGCQWPRGRTCCKILLPCLGSILGKMRDTKSLVDAVLVSDVLACASGSAQLAMVCYRP